MRNARVEEDIEKGMALESPRESARWEWDTGSDNQKNLGSVAGDLNRAVLSLGLSWVLDEVRAHARKATDLLMALCDLDFWTSLRFFGTDYRLPWRGTLETAGHAHADAGAFVLYSRDELMLIDSGICGYEMPEYQGYYHTTRAHNTVLVGNEGQIKRLAGRIVEEAGVPGLSFVLGDATAPYEGRLSQFLRGVLFIGGEYYVVVDWLRKKGDEPFQWLLHCDGEVTKEVEGIVIRKGKAGVLVKMVEPTEHHLVVRQGYKTYHEDLSIVKSTEEKQQEME